MPPAPAPALAALELLGLVVSSGCVCAVFSVFGWIVTSPLLLPLSSNKSTESSSSEHPTIKGMNQTGRLAFFRGPKGFAAVFFFFGFLLDGALEFATGLDCDGRASLVGLGLVSLVAVGLGEASAEVVVAAVASAAVVGVAVVGLAAVGVGVVGAGVVGGAVVGVAVVGVAVVGAGVVGVAARLTGFVCWT